MLFRSDTGIGLPATQEYISFYNQAANNVYSLEDNRRENVRFIFASGSTVEFWMKKNAYANNSTQTNREAIFYTKNINNSNNQRLSIFLRHPNTGVDYERKIFTNYWYEASSTQHQEFSFTFDTGLTTIADSNWHHYAFVYYTSSASTYAVDFYLDGNFKQTQQAASNLDPAAVSDITGAMFSTIGS